VRRVTRWLCATVAEVVLSGFAFLLLTGRYINEGGVVVVLTRDHGLHSGDFFILAGWVAATAALLVLAVPRRTPARVGADAGPRRGE
jgi:hypothetical protein